MATRLLAALLLLLACCGLAPMAAAASPAPGDLLAEGRALYVEGRRADGQPLAASRAGGLAMTGEAAACVNCHRRSGMGSMEGRSYIPPITAASLFQPMPVGKGASAQGDGRPAYDEAAVGQAVRHGVDPSGRTLDFVMPRYQLSEREVRALNAYLRQLPAGGASTAEAGTLDFATVIAPGIAPERSRAMVGVLQACFDEHNKGPQPERGRHKLAPGMSQHEERPWRLHVWTLQGPQETWSTQLAQHAQAQPVFAMVGGIGGGQWEPVHRFCERDAVPCLFPHVDVPVADAQAFYPLYLGKGVLLEAGLIARQLGEANRPHVVQVLREEDAAARAGADALQQALVAQGGQVRRIALQGALDARAFADLAPDDVLVLWLRPADLQRLEGVAPAGGQAYVSATLAERDPVPLPTAWKARALMPYPFELPQQRTRASASLASWLQAHHVAGGDERIEADAYVACSALRTAMHDAQQHLGGAYLVERLEADMERTTATGLYPRLALGIGQRFASKAGYLVRFDPSAPGGLAAVGERVAP